MEHKHTAWVFGGGEDGSWAKPLVMGPVLAQSIATVCRSSRETEEGADVLLPPTISINSFILQILLTLNTKPVIQEHRILFVL